MTCLSVNGWSCWNGTVVNKTCLSVNGWFLLSPGHDRVVTIKSRNFFYCKSLVSGFLCCSTRGCRKHAPFRCESCWQPPLCPPTFVRWSKLLNQMSVSDVFETTGLCMEYGNRTREYQSGHQSSYWLWTSVLNFSDLMRTSVTHSPPHPPLC